MISAIIQARVNSTRLPNKVLKRVCGKTLLEHEVSRVKRVKSIDSIIIATTRNKDDNAIARVANRLGVRCFRGEENDVLDRYYHAAQQIGADDIVRITGDCPLIDPTIIDLVVGCYLKNKRKFDYISNVSPPTFPDGMDVEVFSSSALLQSWREAKLPSEREHVTPYITNNPNYFRIKNVMSSRDMSHLRFTVDEPRDLILIRKIFLHLYPRKTYFILNDIIELIKHDSKLTVLNAGINRNEGYINSLRKDNLVA